MPSLKDDNMNVRKYRIANIFFVCCIFFLNASAIAKSSRELQFENEHVKVWKTTIPPGNGLKMHRHDAPRIIVGLKGGTLTKIEETGERSDLTFETNKAYWLAQDPPEELHGDINQTEEDIVVMVIEFNNEQSQFQ